ncbi:zinc finger matrin-type protein 3-like [Synchiropus splendidus]|uniref:zinc finger matrin-type protein 3-like n=1 Tax=Synchiropus splendidus TaxID=270530 RepID=UPI00237EE2FD|nr:zinc finger matrin-type protein 3-like [Synchiropus splendidus]
MALDRRLRLVPEAGSAGHDSKGVLSRGEPCLGDLCGPLDCRLCDVTLNSLQQGHAHYQSQVMPATEADYGQLSSSSPEVAPTHYNRMDHRAYHTHRRRIPRDLTMCVTPSGHFYCSLCNCGAEQESDFRRHLSSKAHRSRASESLYRTENLGHS